MILLSKLLLQIIGNLSRRTATHYFALRKFQMAGSCDLSEVHTEILSLNIIGNICLTAASKNIQTNAPLLCFVKMPSSFEPICIFRKCERMKLNLCLSQKCNPISYFRIFFIDFK